VFSIKRIIIGSAVTIGVFQVLCIAFWGILASTNWGFIINFYFTLLLAWQHKTKVKFYLVYDYLKKRQRVHHYWLGFITAIIAVGMFFADPEYCYIEIMHYVYLPWMIGITVWIFGTEFKDIKEAIRSRK